jgi:hypothetical protein
MMSKPVRHSIINEVVGAEGSYEIDGKTLTVFYEADTDATDLGEHAAQPELLAQVMLGQMVVRNKNL